MMRYAAIPFGLVLAGLTSGVLAQSVPTVPVETLRTITQTLSSDAYEGRAPTSPVEAKTIKYIAERMAKAGLMPGNKGSWYQDVPIVEITSTPTPLSFTGGKAPLDLAYKTDMVVGTLRVLPKIAVTNSDVVFVGYGINAPQLGWNDYAGIDVKGKTVLILINDPDWQVPTLDGNFGGRAMTYYGRWTYKYEEAARQGAAAAIIIHDTEPAAYPWDVVLSSWAKPRLNLDAADNHADESAAIGWITGPSAARVFANAGLDFDSARLAAKQAGFKSMPLGMKMSLTMENSIRRQASKNVVGILPGKQRPKEYVLYSAHWDHLGHCTPVKGDGICNGALDNASGVGALIALAEMNAKAGAAARSQVFLSVTAEESGLLGSQYYAEHPLYPLSDTVGGVNMDGLNVLGATKDVVIVGVGKSELDAVVTRWAAKGGRMITPEASPEKGYYYRSDHFSMARLGVPMIAAGSGEDLVVGGTMAGHAAAEDYTTNRYHKPQDEYNAAWDWAGAVQDLTMYYGIGRELAEGSAWPNWNTTAEFRAIRDKSRDSAK